MPSRDGPIVDIECRKLRAMEEPDRMQDYLARLTPISRSNLLTELERLEGCNAAVPGSAPVVEKLRAEFRKDGQNPNRVESPSRHFFAPLEALLAEGAPEHDTSGRILRGSLPPIWEWISRNLLPTMARDYVNAMNRLIAADNQREAARVTSTFQTKVVKSLEGTLGSPAAAELARAKLSIYTASRAAYDDIPKMLCVLRARDALAKFGDTLPATIGKFDDLQVIKISKLLDAFRKTNADALPFALALVATRLKTPWQLIRLATKGAPSKKVADVAATPYALAVPIVLDRMDDSRLALQVALKHERILVAKDILTDLYDTEYALHVRIDRLEESDWGKRLQALMSAVAVLVDAEVNRFPDNVDHVLASRSLRSHQSLAGRLTHLAWKGRDVVSGGAAFCKKLVGQ
jgi:hypothetical protein